MQATVQELEQEVSYPAMAAQRHNNTSVFSREHEAPSSTELHSCSEGEQEES